MDCISGWLPYSLTWWRNDLPILKINELKLTSSDIKKILLSLFGLIIFFILLINEIPRLTNVFKLPLVIGITSGLGLIFAIVFSSKVSVKAEELIEKFQIYVASIIVSLILFPLVINFVNRLHTVEIEEEFVFVSVEEMYGLGFKGSARRGEIPQPTAYLVSLERQDGSIENVRFTKNISEGLNRGDRINLPVKRGIFRIHYMVTE